VEALSLWHFGRHDPTVISPGDTQRKDCIAAPARCPATETFGFVHGHQKQKQVTSDHSNNKASATKPYTKPGKIHSLSVEAKSTEPDF